MNDDAARTAKSILAEFGREQGERHIAMRLADQRRGGDAEAIEYWADVLKAFKAT